MPSHPRTYRSIAFFSIVTLLVPILAYVLTPEAYGVADIEWKDAGTFGAGVFQNATTTGNTVTLAHDMTGAVTDTTYDDFRMGNTAYDGFSMTAVAESGEVGINQGWVYGVNTLPALESSFVQHSFIDNNLLYVSTYGGLSVINTEGTVDPVDDTLVTRYYTGSTPALGNDTVYHSFLDNNLLYVSTNGGLSVINTEGTVDPGDDTLVTTYTTGSTPALAHNDVENSFLDPITHLLYVSTYGGGLSVINTEGTVDPVDDTLVTRYYTGSTPALGNDTVYHTFLDSNLLYVSTQAGGLSVINTEGTVDPGDDTLVTTYNTASTPALADNHVQYSYIDSTTHLLYASTNGGLSVINTEGTVDPVDDTLVTRYYTGSTPALGSEIVYHSFLDNNLLYVSTWGGGLSVINTEGTVDPVDDTLVTRYHVKSVPALSGNSVYHSFLDPTTDLLYVNVYYGSGLSVINLNDEYNAEGEFFGSAKRITETPTTTLTWNGDIPEDTAVSLQYRTGTSDAVYFNDFDDNLTTEYAGDYYGWGNVFQDVEESAGTMKLSNPDTGVIGDDSWVYSWLDTEKPDDYFPLGSKVTARVRINSNTRQISSGGWWEYIFTDDWWDGDGTRIPNNEWYTFSFTTGSKTFSKLGFEINWKTGTSSPTDTFEIDWIKIETPDSFGKWNAWSTPCLSTTCAIDPSTLTGNEWIQYKLNLSTDNPNTTPKIHSVSYTNGYHTSGTYTSEDITLDGTQPLSFTTTQTTPASTTLSYAYSTTMVVPGQTWHPLIHSPHPSLPPHSCGVQH